MMDFRRRSDRDALRVGIVWVSPAETDAVGGLNCSNTQNITRGFRTSIDVIADPIMASVIVGRHLINSMFLHGRELLIEGVCGACEIVIRLEIWIHVSTIIPELAARLIAPAGLKISLGRVVPRDAA